jgi:hypothetical protein
MNLRLTASLALVALFLGLLLQFWGREKDVERSRLEQARRAFRFDAARIDRLVLDTGSLSIECVRKGNQWMLVRPIAARSDPVAIERLLGTLQELPRGEVILPPSRAPEAYAAYGLEDPRIRIQLVEGSSTNRIHVGRRTPLGDGVYVRQPDRPGIVRIRADLLGLMPASVDSLRDRSLLVGAPASIDRLDVRGPSGYIQLARDADGSWRFFQPFTARADSATVVALIEQLLACSVSHFVQDGVRDLAPYGLDSHGAVTALLNSPNAQGSQMLAFGDPLPNSPHHVYARLQAEDSVYAVPASVRQALLVHPDDLRDRRIPGIEPEAIQRIRAVQGEEVLELVREAGQWNLLAPVRAPANPEAVEKLLRSWADVRLLSFETQPPTNPPPLSRSLHVELRDARPASVDFRIGPVPGDPTRARIEIDGDSALGVVSPAHLLDFTLDPLFYRSLDVAHVSPDDVASIRVVNHTRSAQAHRDPSTGVWPPEFAWMDNLLAALSPLRAEALLQDGAADAAFDSPYLTVNLQLRGQGGLSMALIVGDEIEPGGARYATLRGRNLLFALSPATVASLLPPPQEMTEQ